MSEAPGFTRDSFAEAGPNVLFAARAINGTRAEAAKKSFGERAGVVALRVFQALLSVLVGVGVGVGTGMATENPFLGFVAGFAATLLTSAGLAKLFKLPR